LIHRFSVNVGCRQAISSGGKEFAVDDPYDVEVLPSHAKARSSRHDIDRLEVMNVVVDHLLGLVIEVPSLFSRVQDLQHKYPRGTYQLAWL
jgi:hypothetical protein